jgi:hypothetical protein
MQNAQPHSYDDQLAPHALILRLLHFLANVTELAIRKSFDPAKAVQPYNYWTEKKMMNRVYIPLMLMLITASEIQAWTKYGGDANCKSILANDSDEAFSERAKGWTFGYISALNEMMQQRFETPPQDELIWQAVKEFCADNPDASHYVASATIYIELLRDQGSPQ